MYTKSPPFLYKLSFSKKIMNFIPPPPVRLYGMGQGSLHQFHMGLEILYASVIIAICIIIFYKTKEFYDLSGHNGIKFFRHTFLFFALAFFFRLIPMFFRIGDIDPWSYRFVFITGVYFFGYASSMAVISLARSVTWKKFKKGALSKALIYHLTALILPLVILFTDDRWVFFLLQAALIIGVFFIIMKFHPHKKKSKMYVTYLLLLLFWMLNLAILTIPKFMKTAIYTLYVLSLVMFVFILYKTIKMTQRQ